MIKEFKTFILRGDVLDLAVGVVIGGAFTAIVNGVVNGLITPLIALVVSMFTNTTNLDGALSVLSWTPKKGVTFEFGDVISAIITFLITGVVLFIVVKSVNKMKELNKKETEIEPEEAQPTAEDYLKDIRDLLQNK
ncbi:large conductance mechanosensitive channel protein MscL [Enterococcus casseliflavus]|nr:large conductance mechanosensitive channel protein MscL [Enterococcus casseliflavus]